MPTFKTTLKNLHTQHFGENVTNNNSSLNDGDLVKNDPITCVQYYEHRINSFHKLLKHTNVLFNKVKDYFFITKFQSIGLSRDHGLLWIKNAPMFGIPSNKDIKNFVNKYLTTNQFILQNQICVAQIHEHKQMCKKKC